MSTCICNKCTGVISCRASTRICSKCTGVIPLSCEYSHLQQMYWCNIFIMWVLASATNALLCNIFIVWVLTSATNALLCNIFIVRVLASATNALQCNIFIVWVLASATNALLCNIFIVWVLASATNALLCNIFIMWVLTILTSATKPYWHCVIFLSCGHSHTCNKLYGVMWAFSHLQQTLLCNMFIYVGILTSATHCCAVSLPCGTHNCNKHTVIRCHRV